MCHEKRQTDKQLPADSRLARLQCGAYAQGGNVMHGQTRTPQQGIHLDRGRHAEEEQNEGRALVARQSQETCICKDL